MIADMSCIFCAIGAGEIPAEVVTQSDAVVAFRDLNPVAPVHVLVIPREHHADVTALAAVPELMTEVMRTVSQVAAQEELGDGFRVVFNTGPRGGQEVGHVHAHVIGGRQMTWPPG